MAIAYQSVSPDTASTAGVANLTSGTFVVSGSDTCLFGFTYTAAGTPATHSGMKWQGSSGTALTQIGSTLSIGSFVRLSAWRLIAPTAATDTIYGDWSAAQDETSIGGVQYTGVDQATPVGTPVTNTGTWTGAGSTDMTVTLTTAVGDVVVAVFGVVDLNGNGVQLTPGGTPAATGRYEIEAAQLAGYGGCQVQEVVATGTSTTLTCAVQTTSGYAAGEWGAIAFVVNAAAGTDTTPDAFSFTDQSNVALSTLTESNAITVSGITAAAAISVTGGEYQINSGSWTSTSGTVNNGDSVKVRHTSSASNSTATNTTLTIGGVSDTFTTTTIMRVGIGRSPNLLGWIAGGA